MTLKKLGVLLACLLIMSVLAACGSKPLPEGFVEEEVLSEAENVVALLSARDYEGVTALFSPAMAELDAAKLETSVGPSLDALGAFDRIKSKSTTGGRNDTVGNYATAVLVCEYEKGNATYTISIDEDGKICGLYMK